MLPTGSGTDYDKCPVHCDLRLFLTALLGLLASWVDRKVTARVQYRVGPPLLQPVRDLVKLCHKETLVPAGAVRTVFLLAPLVGFAGVAVVSALLWGNNLQSGQGFLGDLFVAVYLFTLPSLAIILGGFASANPLASLGAAREMKLLLAYELPFLLVILVPVIQSGYTLRIGEIIAAQGNAGPTAASLSGALAVVAAILCIQAKLGLVPFDVPEAETEIGGGVLIEYSGPPLAVYRLTKCMLLFALPFFIILLFLGGVPMTPLGMVGGALKYAVLVALATVIRNTNPRLRIDQAVRFFWGPVTAVAVAAVLLALGGW